MARRQGFDPAGLDALAGVLASEDEERTLLEPVEFRPEMGEAQAEIYDSDAKYLLAYGEKGSGKTYVAGGHKIAKHLWRNFNAHVIIVLRLKGQGEGGGCWLKLQTMILPEWKANQAGFDYSEPYVDRQGNETIDVKNQFGEWSRVTLMSESHGPTFMKKIRNYEPSYIFIDELTTFDSDEFFVYAIQQLGRRPGIRDVQQFVAATNPESPEHWVYIRFFVMPGEGDERRGIPEGEWDDDFHVVHVPFTQNEKHMAEDYRSRILVASKGDPTLEAQMMRGEWVARPTGKSIFREVWVEDQYVVGGQDGSVYRRPMPNPRWEVIIGYDLGAANNGIVLMQHIPMRGRMVWLVFDEFTQINRRVKYQVLVPKLMERLAYWQKHANEGKPFRYLHIGDNSAFNQYRPGAGTSFDAMEVERVSEQHAKRLGVPPIKMKPAPKFPGSVRTRVRMAINLVADGSILVSDSCTRVKEMFLKLESESDAKGYDPDLAFTPRRSQHLHTFDALTYPMLTIDARPGMLMQNVPMSAMIMGKG